MTKEQEEQSRVALLPCPFCGGKPIERLGAVHCDDCGACPISQDKDAPEQNRVAWNTRVTPSHPDKAEVVEQIRALLPHCRPAHVTHQMGRLLDSLTVTRDDNGMVEELVGVLEALRVNPNGWTSDNGWRITQNSTISNCVNSVRGYFASRENAARAKAGAV